MKTYYGQLLKIHDEATSELKKLLEKESVVKLFDFENEDWEDNDDFHDLPQQLTFTDPMYDNYYLHKVYLEDNTICILGFAPELEEHYDFTVEEISKDEFIYLVDEVLDAIAE